MIRLLEEYRAWVRGEVKESEHLRFGQYICNKYLKDGISCPSIFYEGYTPNAFEKICRELSRG